MTNGLLIVEDESMLQIYLEDICSMAGFKVGCIAGTVAEARECLQEHSFDAAIIDVNLKGETTEELAGELRLLAVPVVVSTGSHPGELPEAYRGMAVLQKPFRPREVEDVLKTLQI